MSLLTIVQNVADMVGLPRPTGAFSSTDTTVRQLITLANMEGRQLSRRKQWQELVREATHTTLAAELQGAITDLMPGLRYPINDTTWNRTQQEPLQPLSARQWQAQQAFNVSGPYSEYRIRQGNLYLLPAPPAGETLAFEYVSNYWCESSGGTGQSAWAADTDVGALSEEIMEAGLRWRFLRAKGMDYAQEFQEYEWMLGDAMARDGANPVIYLDNPAPDSPRTIRAPLGSWSP